MITFFRFSVPFFSVTYRAHSHKCQYQSMPNQKLLEALSCFTEKDKKKFKEFVQSTFYNNKYNRLKVSQLLDVLLALKKEEHTIEEIKETLSKKFFPEHDYLPKAKNPIDSLASDLFSLTRRFILIENRETETNKGHELLAMARFYRKNNMEVRFWQIIKQFRSYQQNIQILEPKHFLQMLEVEEEVAAFQSTFNTYTNDSNLVVANIALDNFYAMTKFELSNALIFQKSLGQVEIKDALRLNDSLLAVFPKYTALHTPLAKLYYQVYQLLNDPLNKELLADFSISTEENEHLVSTDKYRNIMAFYRYFVGQQYQLEASGIELIERLFVLYKDHLAKGYFDVDKTGVILPASLKLMINIALKIGENEWAKELLTKYPPKKITGTHYPVETHSLCLAEILFAEQKHEEALEHLIYRNFENINYSILADILLIKIYYETKNELLDSRISALGQKVRRSKLTQANKKQYLNFLTIITQIVKFSWLKDKKQRDKLAKKINQLLPLIEREWLKSVLKAVE